MKALPAPTTIQRSTEGLTMEAWNGIATRGGGRRVICTELIHGRPVTTYRRGRVCSREGCRTTLHRTKPIGLRRDLLRHSKGGLAGHVVGPDSGRFGTVVRRGLGCCPVPSESTGWLVTLLSLPSCYFSE
jgi:hypothetical protein